MSKNEELRARIEAAKQADKPAETSSKTNTTAAAAASAMGHAFGWAVAVCIGGAIGYWIDSMLGSSPWALLIFLVFGMVAGFLNIVRAANKMAREAMADAEANISPKTDE
ncbi:MAG: AtpZ/AtpI family protein [Pseudomonadota bacterium]